MNKNHGYDMSQNKLLPKFNSEYLGEVLKGLPGRKQLAFALSCCERLIPNYGKFYNETNWGNVKQLSVILDYLWSFITEEDVDRSQISELIMKCEACAPIAEDFESLYVSSAQDACLALCQTLDYLLDESVNILLKWHLMRLIRWICMFKK